MPHPVIDGLRQHDVLFPGFLHGHRAFLRGLELFTCQVHGRLLFHFIVPTQGFLETLKTVPVGTDLTVVQEGLPDVIPVEACYVGWQESLVLLALLVEAEIPDAPE